MESYVYTRCYGTLNCLGCKLALRPTADLASAPTNFWSNDFPPEAQGEPPSEQPAPKGAHRCSNPPSLPLWCHHSWSKSQTESESKKGTPKSQASLVPILTEKPRHWKQLKAIIESNLNSKYMGFQRKKTAMKWHFHEKYMRLLPVIIDRCGYVSFIGH